MIDGLWYLGFGAIIALLVIIMKFREDRAVKQEMNAAWDRINSRVDILKHRAEMASAYTQAAIKPVLQSDPDQANREYICLYCDSRQVRSYNWSGPLECGQCGGNLVLVLQGKPRATITMHYQPHYRLDPTPGEPTVRG